MAPPAAVPVVIRKPETYRNALFSQIARRLPCRWPAEHVCSGDHMWCHSNHQADGKGMGLKASDACGMVACKNAHDEYDQGRRFSYEQKAEYFARASLDSLVDMIEGGWLVPSLAPLTDL